MHTGALFVSVSLIGLFTSQTLKERISTVMKYITVHFYVASLQYCHFLVSLLLLEITDILISNQSVSLSVF